MSKPHPNIIDPSDHVAVRQRAPLKSVSTRIILCVFASTLLTATIVSWLCIGAIHDDIRDRISQRADHILEDATARVDRWRTDSTTQLTSAVRVGSPWHARLIRTLEENPEQTTWYWASSEYEGPKPNAGGGTMPSPDLALMERFDQIALYRAGSDAAIPPGCMPARIDVVRANSDVSGFVIGCLAEGSFHDALETPSRPLRGVRLLIVDQAGLVHRATGVRAEQRVGTTLPMQTLLYPESGRVAIYESDRGERLVGALAMLPGTTWALVAESDYAIAFAPAIAITNQIFVVDICIILLFSVLAHRITQAIMQPIDALSRGARRIAEGHVDYEIPMPANGDDELGLLVGAFNGMMRKLRSNQLEIEQDHMRLAEKNEELQRANEILAQLSITDGLTKLHNHRYFQDHLTREIKRVSRTKAPLSLILLDIDDFKLLNDTHGHAAGDDVLVSLAGIMNDSARESDLIARYGGEEFVILMPNTDLAGAVHLAEKVRMTVESTRLIVGDNMKPINITISLGVALFRGDRREFFTEADKALYQAKAAGKNCVIIAGSEVGLPPA